MQGVEVRRPGSDLERVMDTAGPRVAGTKPLTLELIGPAGVGKTTLLCELTGRDPELRVMPTPGGPYLFTSLLATAPFFSTLWLYDYRRGRWFSRAEIRSMLYLQGWPGELHRRQSAAKLIFDHGPLYRLAWLSEFGPPVSTSARYRHWWQRQLRCWADTLDWVVWLDTPTELLLERVRNRADEHLIKHRPRPHAERFLRRYQNAYRRIVDALGPDGPRLLRLDSAADGPAQLAAAVSAALSRQKTDQC